MLSKLQINSGALDYLIFIEKVCLIYQKKTPEASITEKGFNRFYVPWFRIVRIISGFPSIVKRLIRTACVGIGNLKFLFKKKPAENPLLHTCIYSFTNALFNVHVIKHAENFPN